MNYVVNSYNPQTYEYLCFEGITEKDALVMCRELYGAVNKFKVTLSST